MYDFILIFFNFQTKWYEYNPYIKTIIQKAIGFFSNIISKNNRFYKKVMINWIQNYNNNIWNWINNRMILDQKFSLFLLLISK